MIKSLDLSVLTDQIQKQEMQSLPDEILLLILGTWIREIKDIKSIERVCWKWNKLSRRRSCLICHSITQRLIEKYSELKEAEGDLCAVKTVSLKSLRYLKTRFSISELTCKLESLMSIAYLSIIFISKSYQRICPILQLEREKDKVSIRFYTPCLITNLISILPPCHLSLINIGHVPELSKRMKSITFRDSDLTSVHTGSIRDLGSMVDSLIFINCQLPTVEQEISEHIE